MSFFRKFLLVVFFICAMYFGGLSTQSDSTLIQGFGFIVVILAFGLLYVISKVMWHAMGFMASFFIIGSVVIFILYSLGLLGQGKSVSSFLTGQADEQKTAATVVKVEASEAPTDFNELEAQMFAGAAPAKTAEDNAAMPHDVSAEEAYPGIEATPTETAPAENDEVAAAASVKQTEAAPATPVNATPPAARPQAAPASGNSLADSINNMVAKVKNMFKSEEQNNGITAASFNPTDYPYIDGPAAVITASILKMRGIYIKLLGIDAPDPGQTCADHHSNAYYCGRRALIWLQNWLGNRPVRCHVVGDVVNNRATGVCFTDNGRYDIAAVVVNAGWAVAYTQNTTVYVPYEQQAAENRRGLWSGRFYKPWDWRKIQHRKVKITVQKKSNDSWFDGIGDFFSGWF